MAETSLRSSLLRGKRKRLRHAECKRKGIQIRMGRYNSSWVSSPKILGFSGHLVTLVTQSLLNFKEFGLVLNMMFAGALVCMTLVFPPCLWMCVMRIMFFQICTRMHFTIDSWHRVRKKEDRRHWVTTGSIGGGSVNYRTQQQLSQNSVYAPWAIVNASPGSWPAKAATPGSPLCKINFHDGFLTERGEWTIKTSW